MTPTLPDPLFPLTEEEEQIIAQTHKVCQKEVVPIRAELDEQAEYPDRVFDAFREIGLFEAMFEAEYGGLGLRPFMTTRIMETIAQYCLGVATSFGASTSLAALPIKLGGTPEQRKRFLPDLASGKRIGALAVTEPNAGSDILNQATTAVRKGETYLLNGTKQWITNAGRADLYCVFAATGQKGGLSCFVLEKGTPGLSFGKLEHKLGIRCSHTRQVIMEDVSVPAENLLGLKPNRGLLHLLRTLNRSRAGVAAMAVGVATGAYREAVRYARQRQQFGQSIIRFQALQHMLSDMWMRIEAARTLAYRAGIYAYAEHPESGAFSAMAKCHASETAMQVTIDAVQLLGGYGYCKEYPVEKMFRDAKILSIYEGANQVLRNQIAEQIVRTSASWA